MPNQFNQIDWDAPLREELRQIVRLAIDEDLGDEGDLTSRALVPEDANGRAAVVAREPGVVAGVPAAVEAVGMVDPRLTWTAQVKDGRHVELGGTIAWIEGPARSILAAERLTLNLLGRLSGIATLTRKYVDAVADTKAQIYDTRKTMPGWRRLDKYAVRCGGGQNHRTGLFDAVLIKDNHLALVEELGQDGRACNTPAEAIEQARRFIQAHLAEPRRDRTVVEIEVDTLDALEQVLPAKPDVVLLDNMRPVELNLAVILRDNDQCDVCLEASGGVTLSTVATVAGTGVDRISVGGLTHSAPCLDIGLDWRSR